MDSENTAVVPEGTPAETPKVEATAPISAGLTEERVRAMIQEDRKRLENDLRSARSAQAAADKRAAEAEKRAQMLENTLTTLPTQLPPDSDPLFVERVRSNALAGQLGSLKQQELARQEEQRLAAAKAQAMDDMRVEVAEMGLDPDDPRVAYDLSAPDFASFRRKVVLSAAKALKEDARKDVRPIEKVDDLKARKETGVDIHETPGAKPDDDKAFAARMAVNPDMWKDPKNLQRIEKIHKKINTGG